MKQSIILFIISLYITLSFAGVLFLAGDSTAVYYTSYSYVKGEYTGKISGRYPTDIINYYIAPTIRNAFVVTDPEFFKSFILLGNGMKFFKLSKDGPSISSNIYNLLNVGDKVYKVSWSNFPKLSLGKVIFPPSFKLMDMVKFVNAIDFPIYTEDLLKDYISSKGATLTIFESKPKFNLIINRSKYLNLPVSVTATGDCERVVWNLNGKIIYNNSFTFIPTQTSYKLSLKVTGKLKTTSSTSITMNFKPILSYKFIQQDVANRLSLKGKWYVPFFGVTNSATIVYNGKISFLAFEYKPHETIVHRFVMEDRMPPTIVDNCNHKFYTTDPFKVNFNFYDNSGFNYQICLNGKRISNYSTMTLDYGKHDLTVRATDNFGNYTVYSTTIRVLDTIPPVIKVSNYSVNENQIFYLDASKCTDNGTIISYKWIVDNKILYGKRVKISLNKSGIYKASLMVTDDSLNVSVANFTIKVKDNVPPLLIFSSTTVEASVDKIVQLSPFMAKDDSGKVSITWIMENPKVFFVGNIFKYKFMKVGTYKIKVIAQDPYHNQTMVLLTVVVK